MCLQQIAANYKGVQLIRASEPHMRQCTTADVL